MEKSWKFVYLPNSLTAVHQSPFCSWALPRLVD